jgi:hypothetical protein
MNKLQNKEQLQQYQIELVIPTSLELQVNWDKSSQDLFKKSWNEEVLSIIVLIQKKKTSLRNQRDFFPY